MSPLRLALVALLLAATALFAAGAIAEPSHASVAREASEHHEHIEGSNEETLLGADTESAPLIVLAVTAGLALAALAATPAGRIPAVLLAIASIAIVWAALDVREAVRHGGETVAGVAIAVAVAHLAAAATAGLLAARDRPGTMRA